MTHWILVHPASLKLARYATFDDATRAALKWNHTDPDHPAIELWALHDRRLRWAGRLWRPFGRGFEANPWSTVKP